MIDRYHILQASTYLKELVSFPHEWGGGGTFTCNLSLRCCFEQPARSYVACLRNSNTWSSQDTKPTTPPQLLNHSGSRMTTFLFLPLEFHTKKKSKFRFFPWNQFHEKFSWNWLHGKFAPTWGSIFRRSLNFLPTMRIESPALESPSHIPILSPLALIDTTAPFIWKYDF